MRHLHDRLACDIGPRDLEPILNMMTPGARNPVMRYLRAIFNYGIKGGYLTENPDHQVGLHGSSATRGEDHSG